MIITIPGRPIPAVRMTQKSKWNSDSAKRYLEYKNFIGIIAKRNFKTPTSEKVNVMVNVYLSGKKTPMGQDGDVDNYLKAALDGLNKIAWLDDRQVQAALVSKLSCDEVEQRMEILISIIK
jgi:Holliday junction resolvase RusA-like endonuclease